MLNQFLLHIGIQLSNESKAAIIGAVVGGILALTAPIIDHALSKRREQKKEQADKAAFLRSIKTELQTLQDRYMFVIGDEIDKHDASHIYKGGLIKNHFDFFTYYEKNADKLGLIQNQELAQKIIKTYIDIKSLYDQLVYYTEISNSVINASEQGESVGIRKRATDKLTNLFERIRRDHDMTKEVLKITMQGIDEEIK